MFKTLPTGKPCVAELKPFSYDNVLDDVKHVLPKHSLNDERLKEWEDFISRRPKSQADADVCTSLPKWQWPLRPPSRGTASQAVGPRAAALRAALAATTVVEQPKTIADGVDASGAEGRRARAAKAKNTEERESQKLRPDSFLMVNFEATNTEGCQIPLMLVQCPSSFGDIDTTKADAAFEVLWWMPKPSAGRYDGEWQRWKDSRHQQYKSTIERSMVQVVNVGFTRAVELHGGYRNLSRKTRKEILELGVKSKYSEYSNDSEELATPAT